MQISPVNFGRIIKVNAPENIVQKVCDLANDEFSGDSLRQDIKKVFPDRFQNGVQRYKQYLLSGEESKTANLYYLVLPTKESYEKSMNLLVQNSLSGEMTVAHNGHRVKAVDIIV